MTRRGVSWPVTSRTRKNTVLLENDGLGTRLEMRIALEVGDSLPFGGSDSGAAWITPI